MREEIECWGADAGKKLSSASLLWPLCSPPCQYAIGIQASWSVRYRLVRWYPAMVDCYKRCYTVSKNVTKWMLSLTKAGSSPRNVVILFFYGAGITEKSVLYFRWIISQASFQGIFEPAFFSTCFFVFKMFQAGLQQYRKTVQNTRSTRFRHMETKNPFPIASKQYYV